MYDIKISVIIPVWNDADRVLKCLAALKEQDLNKENYEVIVVDNNSTDNTYEVLKSVDWIVLAQEKKVGSYNARNTGLKLAKGEYVAFTDSDCVPSKDWLSTFLHISQINPNLGVGVGRIDFFTESNKRTEIGALLFEKIFSMDQLQNAQNGKCITANWFSRKDLIERIGPFDGQLKSGGDHKLSKKISTSGYDVIYVNNAFVNHPARNIDELIRKRKRVIGGTWDSKKSPFKAFELFYSSTKLLIKRIFKVFVSDEISGKDKLSLIFLLFHIFLVSVQEIIMLQFGKNSTRS